MRKFVVLKNANSAQVWLWRIGQECALLVPFLPCSKTTFMIYLAQVVLRVYTKGCLSRDVGPDGCLQAITQVFRFPGTLSLWQYARGRTLVRWTAYRGTLLSVLEYAAQRTTVILPNVLLYFSPTYWHLDGNHRDRYH